MATLPQAPGSLPGPSMESANQTPDVKSAPEAPNGPYCLPSFSDWFGVRHLIGELHGSQELIQKFRFCVCLVCSDQLFVGWVDVHRKQH